MAAEDADDSSEVMEKSDSEEEAQAKMGTKRKVRSIPSFKRVI